MIIDITKEGGKTTLFLDGRLDATTSPKLLEVLIPAFEDAAFVKLDLTKLNYVSSAGLRVLLMGHKTAKTKNIPMTVSCASEDIMEVFDMTGFSNVLVFE